MKYLFISASIVFAAVSHAQSVIKYKDDFGLICPNNSPSAPVILYSPKNKVQSVGYRQVTPFERQASIITNSFIKTNDAIFFKTNENPGNGEYEISRSSLTVFKKYEGSYTAYDSDGNAIRKTLHSNNVHYCTLMSDEDFIETVKYDLAQNPERVVSPPAQKPKNKL